jgi:hypothetical protein
MAACIPDNKKKIKETMFIVRYEIKKQIPMKKSLYC